MKKQGIILAGGKGKRLLPITKHLPKPLVNIQNKPFIYYLIKQLEKFDFDELIILAGYKSGKFKIFEKKFKKEFKLKLKIIYQPVEWETSKRLNNIKKKINPFFYLFYSDNFVNINQKYFNEGMNKMLIQSKFLAREKGNIKLIKNNIFDYDETRSKSYNYVELGYFCLKKKLIFNLIDDKNVSFSKIILKLIKLKKLNYFKTNSIYLSITNNNNLLRTNKLIKKYFQFFHK